MIETFWSFFFSSKRIWGNIFLMGICILFYTYTYIDISNGECSLAGAILLLSITSFVFFGNFFRDYFIWKKNNRK